MRIVIRLVLVLVVLLVVALGALFFRLANWKCPNCGEGLPTRRSRPTCLGCGLPLE